MVNADHAQRRALCPRCKVDRHRGLVKCRGNGIYRDRVMWVRSVGVRRKYPLGRVNLRIGAHVANDG